MKKNIAMRVAAILFILTMISTCAFSTTFAKYVTSGTADDEARVAKWGVTIVATDDGDAKTVLDTKDGNNEAEICVDKELKLLAPGTKGNLVTVNVQGQPEVAVDVDIVFTIEFGDEWKANGVEYCPIVFTVNGVTYGTTDTGATNTYPTIPELKSAIETVVKSVDQVYNEYQDFNSILDLTIDWEWAFEGDDAKDTALGDLAPAPTLEIDYKLTMTQVD